jgi:hypothetical protein
MTEDEIERRKLQEERRTEFQDIPEVFVLFAGVVFLVFFFMIVSGPYSPCC